jgi:arylsulfatase A-like enzyme
MMTPLCRLRSILAIVLMPFLLGTAITHCAVAADTKPRQPNILFILADDQRWDTIRALGNHEIQTPHLDGLVERGFHFTNAYCMGGMIAAVCTPSRTMIATGRSLWHIPDWKTTKTAPPGMPLLPLSMASAGYVTFHCGKRGNECSYANATYATNIELDGRTADSATDSADHTLTFLRGHDPQRPFFIYLAPPVPHDPRLAPAKFTLLYDPAKITLSPNFLAQHPFDNGWLTGRDEVLAPHPRTPEMMRQHLADYYATISHFDEQVGRVLDLLRERNLLDHTIVVYSSDQGLAVGGRHGLMGKQNLYEHVKPPLIFAGPGIPHGKSDALVYLFDLYPTFCELSGAPTPKVLEGHSLLGIVQGREQRVRDELLAAFMHTQRMVREERWKLIQYNVSGVKHSQLFDLSHDPDELHNLADDPRFAAERMRLEQRMTRARQDFNDSVDFTASNPKPAS